MNKRLVVGAAMAALLMQASAAAFAAVTTSSHSANRRPDHFETVYDNEIERCSMADSEYHQIFEGSHAVAPSADVQTLHREGVRLCRGGADMQGIDKQDLALKEGGVKPGIF